MSPRTGPLKVTRAVDPGRIESVRLKAGQLELVTTIVKVRLFPTMLPPKLPQLVPELEPVKLPETEVPDWTSL